MDLLHKARLSVQRVSKKEWDFILALAQQPGP
jgi:predicted RNA-binding protein with PUA-like domain